MSLRMLQKKCPGQTWADLPGALRRPRPTPLRKKSSGGSLGRASSGDGVSEQNRCHVEHLEKAVVEANLADGAQIYSQDTASCNPEEVVPGLAKLFETSQLLDYLPAANAWCDEEGAIELHEIVTNFKDLACHIGLKPLQEKRLERSLQATFEPSNQIVEEAKATEAVENAMASGDAGMMKLALSKVAKLKLKSALVDKCKEHHKIAEQAEVDIVAKRMSSLAKGIIEQMPKNVQYVLVSGPEHSLDGDAVLNKAIKIVTACGGSNKAGDAKDWFHSMMMSSEHMTSQVKGWRIAWKSKVCAYLVDLRKFFPNDNIVFMTIDGGPECEWELAELKGDIKRAYPWYQLLRFRDLAALEAHFVGGAPLPSHA